MKISKRSWHYRFLAWVYSEYVKRNGKLPMQSLCEYIRELILFPLFCIIFSLPILIFWICYGIYLGCSWLYSKLPEFRRKTSGESNIVITWMKAKKEKICPIIEYVE